MSYDEIQQLRREHEKIEEKIANLEAKYKRVRNPCEDLMREMMLEKPAHDPGPHGRPYS